MQVIPAIDMRGGRCVRLVQGDYDRETVFDEDPVAVARRWQAAGAGRIHIVDLDGARSGIGSHREQVGAIVRAVDIPLQVGGGIRTAEGAAALLAAGVERVILGTAALKDPMLVEELIGVHGAARVIVGIDARGGLVATDGWRETSTTAALDLVRDMQSRGVERVVYTDIERDGTFSAPNFDETARVADSGIAVIASGGVGERVHLDRLAAIPGVEAVIVGSALYTGAIELGRDEWNWPEKRQAEGDAA